MHRILFVCMGNICRSPSAEGVLRSLVIQRGLEQNIHIDSAGTGDWHVGNPPDRRARQAALERGVDISGLRARQVQPDDLESFDLVLAMDRSNHNALLTMATESNRHKVRLLLDFSTQWPGEEVPDPYYGGEHGFDQVLDLLEEACDSLLNELDNLHR